MGFRQNGYFTVWGTTIYEKYTVVELSSSKKNKQSGKYETDWSSRFVKFIGQAHKDAVALKRNDRIRIGECEVTNKFDKAKGIMYTDYLVFNYTLEATTTPTGADSSFMVIPDDAIDDLPFA